MLHIGVLPMDAYVLEGSRIIVGLAAMDPHSGGLGHQRCFRRIVRHVLSRPADGWKERRGGRTREDERSEEERRREERGGGLMVILSTNKYASSRNN